MEVQMFLDDLMNNVMEVISSRAERTPTSELEPELCETDYAPRAKVILDITFSRVLQRLTKQQVHLPPPVEQTDEAKNLDKEAADKPAEEDISVPESSKASIDRSEEDSLHEGIIRHAGVSLKHSNADVFVVDLSFVPRKKEHKKAGIFGKSKIKHKEIINSMCRDAQDYIERSMKSDKFVVLIHSSAEDRTAMPSGKFARKFYRLLKERFSNELLSCFIIKPNFKLKASVFLRRPFLQKAMRRKIHLTCDVSSFLEDQGLPDSVLSIC